MELVARLAIKQAKLGMKPNSEKKIAVILSNYPTKDARIGNAVGLDTPNSAVLVLNALKDAGYKVTGHTRNRRRTGPPHHRAVQQ